MSANNKQVGGLHYKKMPGEQHWDRQWRIHGRGYFVGCSTKYIERYFEKNGKQDLEKAIHFIQKLIELEYGETCTCGAEDNPTRTFHFKTCKVYEIANDQGAEPDGRYVNQD